MAYTEITPYNHGDRNRHSASQQHKGESRSRFSIGYFWKIITLTELWFLKYKWQNSNRVHFKSSLLFLNCPIDNKWTYTDMNLNVNNSSISLLKVDKYVCLRSYRHMTAFYFSWNIIENDLVVVIKMFLFFKLYFIQFNVNFKHSRILSALHTHLKLLINCKTYTLEWAGLEKNVCLGDEFYREVRLLVQSTHNSIRVTSIIIVYKFSIRERQEKLSIALNLILI